MQRPGKQSFGAPVRVMPDCWDVVGLGQAMVSLFLRSCCRYPEFVTDFFMVFKVFTKCGALWSPDL